MPTARTSARPVVLGHDIYLLGGMAFGEVRNRGNRELDQVLNVVESYDAAANQWRTRKPVPGAGVLGAAAVGARLYAFAGERHETFEYDPAVDLWSVKRRMPAPGNEFGDFGVTALNGHIYVAGGGVPEPGQGIRNTAALWDYDPRKDTWTQRAPMSVARHALCLAAAGGRVYAIGGVAGNSGRSAKVEAYDPRNDVWISRPDLPAGVAYAAAVEVEGRIAVVGGIRDDGTIQIYDLDTGRWSIHSSATARRIHASAAILAGRLYLFGGMEFGSGAARIVPTTEEGALP